eukprot:TRINITY_DN28222_c0_g1_i1.p1 TRINITY_DN28222_c0_g1~~TRINITY_DN28222_c0_g1_i1.p1  ORF type:complete len:489 (+),score=132.81 TRINITY_DN28222_c0_g1_i1:210-1676(+)
MGNTAGLAVPGGWFFSSDRQTQVLLRLNDVRNVPLSPGEQLHGLVSCGRGSMEVEILTKSEPARLFVGMDSVLALEFRAVSFPAVSEAQRAVSSSSAPTVAGRLLGEVFLPLQHVAHRCGSALYKMWLPLTAPQGPQQELSPGGSPSSQSSAGIALDDFDKLLRTAARDPRWPMVCLSLCHAEAVEARQPTYELTMPPGAQVAYFGPLLHSHAQHARLLQALYRLWRLRQQAQAAGKAPKIPGAGGISLESSFAGLAHPPGGLGNDVADGLTSEESIARLQGEISATTSEANARINQAGDAIRTLEERLQQRQAQLQQMRLETQRLRHEGDALELENDRLERQHGGSSSDHRGAGYGSNESPDMELKRLKQDAAMLREQTEALRLIVADLKAIPSGSASDGPVVEASKASAGKASTSTMAAQAQVCKDNEDVSLTKLLPPPSGLLEDIDFSHKGPLPASQNTLPLEKKEESQDFVNLLPRPSELFDFG